MPIKIKAHLDGLCGHDMIVPCPNILEAMSPLFSSQFAPMDAMGYSSMSIISTLVAQCLRLQ
jgi:hypothetical protein